MICFDHPLRDAQDICISSVAVMSGIRPKGRVVDQRPGGRSSHGLLYIWEGSVCISPIRYRNRLRINRAQLLLRDCGCTVAEAAYASGFDNVGYFCRYYKKTTGETPLETKKKDMEVPRILP